MIKNDLTTHKISIAGLNSSYLTIGSGKPIILLHGWGGNKDSWRLLIEALKTIDFDLKKFKLYALDLPGFGDTNEPPQGWNINNYANWLEKFLVKIYKHDGLQGDYSLIVHSFGGRMLMKLFDNQFEHEHGVAKPDKLILIAAAGIKPTETIRIKIAKLVAKIGKSVLKLSVLNRLAPIAQKILYKTLRTHDYEKSTGVMRETFLNIINEDLKGSLDHITNPTLIVWGVRDSYVPVKDARIMHEKIVGSELHIIKDGKHGIHKTHAPQIAVWIKQFLNK
jgi:pimeloyl-ACP methyl ester carboxylesterase